MTTLGRWEDFDLSFPKILSGGIRPDGIFGNDSLIRAQLRFHLASLFSPSGLGAVLAERTRAQTHFGQERHQRAGQGVFLESIVDVPATLLAPYGAFPAPSSVLIRADGYIAWVGVRTQEGFFDGLSDRSDRR